MLEVNNSFEIRSIEGIQKEDKIIDEDFFSTLIQRLFEAANNDLNTSTRLELDEDIIEAGKYLEEKPEEAVKLAKMVLEIFDQHRLEERNDLAQSIGGNIGASEKRGAYSVMHHFFQTIKEKIENPEIAAATLNQIDSQALAHINQDKKFPDEFPPEVFSRIIQHFVESNQNKEVLALMLTTKPNHMEVNRFYHGRLSSLNIRTAEQAIEFVKNHGENLKFINITGIKFKANELEELLKYLPNVNTFIADYCGLDHKCAEVIAAAPTLNNLTSLALRHNQIQDAGITAMAASETLGNLKELSLNECKIKAAGVEAIAASTTFSNLTWLDLSFNSIGAGVRAIASSEILGKLEKLDLCSCFIETAGAETIAASTTLKNLTWLDLSGCYIRIEGVRAITAAEILKNLKYLNLGNNQIQDEGAQLVAASPIFGNLVKLSLDKNSIMDDGTVAISASTTLVNLKELSLYSNKIKDVGAKAIVDSTNFQLTNLELRGNEITTATKNLLRIKMNDKMIFNI